MTEHSFNKQNDAKNAAETPTEWNQFAINTNRYCGYRGVRTIEEQSARTTEAVLFSLKGATLTMTDALKIAAAARECVGVRVESAADSEVQNG